MNENLNLVEILKNEPKGRKLYSPLFGEVTFGEIGKGREGYPIEVYLDGYHMICFSNNGQYYNAYKDAECLLFPSKEQRDWSKFEPTKADLPIDTYVMVKTKAGGAWKLKIYKGNRQCQGIDSSQCVLTHRGCDTIIPFDKFNPNDIEESLKHKI